MGQREIELAGVHYTELGVLKFRLSILKLGPTHHSYFNEKYFVNKCKFWYACLTIALKSIKVLCQQTFSFCLMWEIFSKVYVGTITSVCIKEKADVVLGIVIECVIGLTFKFLCKP